MILFKHLCCIKLYFLAILEIIISSKNLFEGIFFNQTHINIFTNKINFDKNNAHQFILRKIIMKELQLIVCAVLLIANAIVFSTSSFAKTSTPHSIKQAVIHLLGIKT